MIPFHVALRPAPLLLQAQREADRAIAAAGGGTLRMAEPKECTVCCSTFSGFNEGIMCCDPTEPHFTCNECFGGKVMSDSTAAMGEQVCATR